MSSASIVTIVSGLVALGCSAAVIASASRKLVTTLRALDDTCRRTDLDRYQHTIEPVSAFQGGEFVHRRLTGMLRADFAPFGAECQRLHAQARALDRRAHYGLLPLAAFGLGCVLYYGFGASP
jgi:hypothetical protein